MAKNSNTSQVYKNWFIWLIFISLIAYFFTREDKQKSVSSNASDDLQSKLVNYMSQLDSGHISGNMLKHSLDEDDKGKIYDRVPIDKLKAGSSLIFGSATSKTDEIVLTILDDSSSFLTTVMISSNSCNVSCGR